jgi:hypothetical protein
MNAVAKVEVAWTPRPWNPNISVERRREMEVEVVRLYQNFVVDIMLEYVCDLFILPSEVDDLVVELALFLDISVYDAAELLHRVKREVVQRMKEVQP